MKNVCGYELYWKLEIEENRGKKERKKGEKVWLYSRMYGYLVELYVCFMFN